MTGIKKIINFVANKKIIIMKKALFLILALGIAFGAYAQTNLEVSKRGTDISQIEIGKSANVMSVLDASQRPLSYFPNLGLIAFTHTGYANEYPNADSNSIITSWSDDNGTRFDHHTVVAQSTGVKYAYPSGVLFSPIGNNDPSQVYVISAGPSMQTNAWDQNYFASIRLDGSEGDVQNIPYNHAQSGAEWIYKDMCVANNGDTYILGYVADSDGGQFTDNYDLVTFKGTKDGNIWTWTREAQSIDFTKNTNGRLNIWNAEGMAFSLDGNIGYKWAVGQAIGTETYAGLQPVLFYTEDAGVTWTQVPINLEDNPFMQYYLPATQDTEHVYPYFQETSAVVDANGTLQMFAKVQGHRSINPDSLLLYYSNRHSMIFNIAIDKANGVKNMMFVDSVMGRDVSKEVCPQYCFGGEIGWNSRLQASRSLSGAFIVVSWIDTPHADVYFEGFNVAPDIKSTGRHINGGVFTFDPSGTAFNLTEDDIYTGTYRFINAASIGKTLYAGEYLGLLLPMSVSVSLLEFEMGDVTAPITHSLLNVYGTGGMLIPMHVGLEETDIPNSFTVSQNYPNPCNGSCAITVNSLMVKPVSIEVSNIMGQTIFTQTEGMLQGDKTIVLDVSGLEAGIYFYTVHVGNQRQTKKMMVN